MSLILKEEIEDTLLPSGKVPVTLIFTSLPDFGDKLNLLPLTRFKPGALALTLLSAMPGIEIVIGLSTPRYTTFILSAEITAELGLLITAKL